MATGHQGQHRSSADAGRLFGQGFMLGARILWLQGFSHGATGDGAPRPAQENLMIEVIKCLGAELRGDGEPHDAVVTFSEMGRSQF